MLFSSEQGILYFVPHACIHVSSYVQPLTFSYITSNLANMRELCNTSVNLSFRSEYLHNLIRQARSRRTEVNFIDSFLGNHNQATIHTPSALSVSILDLCLIR